MNDHLDAEQIRALVEGRSIEGLAHLESDCAGCHALFARLYDDDTLARLLEAEAAVVPAIEPAIEPAPRRRLWLWAPAMALAAALLFWVAPQPDGRDKGAGAPVVTMSAHAGVETPGVGVEVRRALADGATVRRDEVLVVDLSTRVDSVRVAFVVEASGRRVPFYWPEDPRSTDQHEYGAFSLSDQSGTITVVAAASATATTYEALVAGWPRDPAVGWTSLSLQVAP